MTSIRTDVDVESVLLSPRPFSRGAGCFLLLPLLPSNPSSKLLPPEVWSKILAYVFRHYDFDVNMSRAERNLHRRELLAVCKDWKALALPLFYAHIYIGTVPGLEKFARYLLASDSVWDSIRRIPYSTPGRWVQDLDLRDLDVRAQSESLRVDTSLSQLVPLLPFLNRIVLNPAIMLSSRVVHAFTNQLEVANMRVLKGIRTDTSSRIDPDDRMVILLRACVNLRELTILGSGLETTEPNPVRVLDPPLLDPLSLPHLEKLVILSMPCSSVMYALLHSPLPSLRHLTISPYDETLVPISLVPRFIHTHGKRLVSLHLYTTKTWPATLSPSPATLLQSCPNLSYLSLENPVPMLTLSKNEPPHPLQVLSVPRPYPEFLAVLDTLMPNLPALKTIRARDVRWLRPGMSSRAQQAGVQGEMVEWRRRLSRKGIQVVDSDWRAGDHA